MTLDRRNLLKLAAVGTVSSSSAAVAHLQPPYPRKKIAREKDLKKGQPVAFTYPDDDAPAFLVKTGRTSIGGGGTDHDVVAYSAFCTHMGCIVEYKKDRFICPCHYSQFDPAVNGQCFQGLASQYLPQIVLFIDRNGDIFADGVEGIAWGRNESV